MPPLRWIEDAEARRVRDRAGQQRDGCEAPVVVCSPFGATRQKTSSVVSRWLATMIRKTRSHTDGYGNNL